MAFSKWGGGAWLYASAMPEKKVVLHQGLKNFGKTWCKKYRHFGARNSDKQST
jgi:hypothetical protein